MGEEKLHVREIPRLDGAKQRRRAIVIARVDGGAALHQQRDQFRMLIDLGEMQRRGTANGVARAQQFRVVGYELAQRARLSAFTAVKNCFSWRSDIQWPTPCRRSPAVK